MNCQETVTQIITLIIKESQQSQNTKAEILAEVMKQCLLSSDDNPNHIYAFDLMSKCEECMKLYD